MAGHQRDRQQAAEAYNATPTAATGSDSASTAIATQSVARRAAAAPLARSLLT